MKIFIFRNLEINGLEPKNESHRKNLKSLIEISILNKRFNELNE